MPDIKKLSALKIIDLMKKNKNEELNSYVKTAPDLDLYSLSMIINQFKSTKNNAQLDYFLKKLEVVELKETRAICTLISISKKIKLNSIVTDRFIARIKDVFSQLSPREISDLIVGIKHLPLPMTEKVNLIEMALQNIKENIDNFTPIDRSAILSGITSFLSTNLIGTAVLLLDRTDKNNFRELTDACNFLSYHPLPEYMNLFKITEDYILKYNPTDLNIIFTKIVHSFSKLKLGSEEFYDFLVEKFFQLHNRIDEDSIGVIYKGLYKSGKLSKESKEQLDKILKQDWNRIKNDHQTIISYYHK